jgi:hypothetical protein
MEKYDWEGKLRTTKNPSKLNWVWTHHNKLITEEEYIKGVKALKEFSIYTGKKKSRKYCTNTLKRQYNYLKSKFGFFTGINN